MTRTEDRLTAALESAAAAVRAETMRPLTAPEPGRPGRARSPGRGATGQPYQRRAWLTAVAAAASIAVLAGALVTLKSQQPSPRPVLAGAAHIGGSEPAVPAFFADTGPGLNSQQLQVMSLATGAVTATEHASAGLGELEFLAEQAQTGNWVAVYSTRQSRELVYRFSITGTGKLTRLTRIKGITLKPQSEDLTVLALSPDGSRLALSQIPPGETTFAYNRIIVLNLKTGAQQVWKDRMVDGAYQPSITSAVWTPDGRSLVFASHMCKLSPLAATGPCFWQFQNLRTPPASGGFQAGPVLLRQSGMGGVNQAPAIAPGARSVVEVRHGTSAGGDFTVVRIDLATGKQVVLHRLGAPGPYQVGPNEGNFILVGQITHSGSGAVLRGWTDDRGFHSVTYRLPLN